MSLVTEQSILAGILEMEATPLKDDGLPRIPNSKTPYVAFTVDSEKTPSPIETLHTKESSLTGRFPLAEYYALGKGKGRLSCWHLLNSFKLSYKEKAILSSFGEASLRPAIDDLHYFEEKGNEVKNKIALLISRCKHHKAKLHERFEAEQPCTPEESLEWLKKHLQAMKGKLGFIKSESDLDRSTSKSKPVVMLRQHLKSVESSIFRIYQKVRGVWIDKEFTFARPDFKTAVLDHFEQSFKDARLSY